MSRRSFSLNILCLHDHGSHSGLAHPGHRIQLPSTAQCIPRRIALVTEAFATPKDTIAFALLFLVLFLFLCLLGGELLLLHSRLCFGWLFLPLLLYNERALPLHPLIVCRYPCPLVVASTSAPRGCTTVCFRSLASVRPLVSSSVSFSASVRPLVPSSVSFSEVFTLSFLPAPLIRQKQ